ncbi:hypothetical protein [Streptomyces sp. H27-C3]|uniref:hypothetical protein n=1 Tax=Streptomyces sp. H27-C3 TaxID=3046305 RepID=UPI0024BAE680|nr:hypothetical protein [Streptomyces sp. H27-C3]MDJ0465049.1 hypothetical protein [Streptomyces sp. H27-C3]
MFEKLRRRRRPADNGPARTPEPAAPPRPEPTTADADTLVRAERLRTTWHQAGLDLDRLGAEPLWFTEVRAGQPVPLGPDERTELTAYAGCSFAAALASDEECAAVVGQIEALPVLREMRDEGMSIHACGAQLSAQSLRTIQEAVRKATAEREGEQRVPRQRRRTLDEAADRAADYLEGR